MTFDDAPHAGRPCEESPFVAFAERLRSGEDRAAQELLARYSAHLVAIARRRLGPRLSVKADADDVLQSVFRTFFRRLGGGSLELRDWASLTGLLSLLTLRKCLRQARSYGASCRDVTLEVSLDGGGLDRFQMLIPDREPTPEEVAIFSELVERLLEGLGERDRQIVRSLLAGESLDDIAARLRRSHRTVQRCLARVRQTILADFDPATGTWRSGEPITERLESA